VFRTQLRRDGSERNDARWCASFHRVATASTNTAVRLRRNAGTTPQYGEETPAGTGAHPRRSPSRAARVRRALSRMIQTESRASGFTLQQQTRERIWTQLYLRRVDPAEAAKLPNGNIGARGRPSGSRGSDDRPRRHPQCLNRGKRLPRKVRRKSDSAWVAMGEYESEVLTAEATSREAAVKRWREMAEPKGHKAKR